MDTITQARSISGFECETTVEDVCFHTVLTADAFLPTPSLLSSPHNHPVFEGHLLLTPKASMVTPVGIYEMEKNDFCIFPPRMYHSAKETEGIVSSIAMSFSFSKAVGAREGRLYSTLTEVLGDLESPLLFRRAFHLAHRLFDLTEEMGRGAVGKPERLKVRTAEVLFALIDLLCPGLRGEYANNLSLATRQTRAIDTFFASNYMRKVTIRDLADAIYLSERQTNRVLEELYGLSFKQKLIETRVHIAMQLLLSTDLPIQTIAAQSGYRSAVGFHSAFRQGCGMTPAKYRSLMRNAKK